MDNLTAVFEIDFKSVVIGVFTVVMAFVFIYELGKKILNILGIEFKAQRAKREDHEKLLQNISDIANLSKHHEEDAARIQKQFDDFMLEMRNEIISFNNNRVHDRAQSFQIQKELTDAQVSISNSVDNIFNKITELRQETNERFNANEEKENKRVQADIKDRIAQYYRHYNSVKRISSMELEALEELITSYELHGGDNSFIHSVVQKEMYTWEVDNNL